MQAVYAGSFDPFTNGHLEVVRQAANVFQRVIVLVADNPGKRHWFEQRQRVAVARDSVGGLADVEALPAGQATVEYAFRRRASLVRGLGEFTDYAAEKTLLGINSRLRPEVETVFLMTKEAHNQVRSSSVREVVKYPFGWRGIRDALPPPSVNAVLLKMLSDWDEGLGDIFAGADLSRYLSRPYHNLEHLVYMLDTLRQEVPERWKDDPALWYAILYHDARVDSDPDVAVGDDIEASLAVFAGDVARNGLSGCSYGEVEALIRATGHGKATFDAAAGVTGPQRRIRDLDLAILGESPYEYARYAGAVRLEYGSKFGYMSKRFKEGRREFLDAMRKRLRSGPLLDPERDASMLANLEWEAGELAAGR